LQWKNIITIWLHCQFNFVTLVTLPTKKRGVPARELERAVIHKLRECGNGSKELRDVIEKTNQKAKGDTASLAEERERLEKALTLQTCLARMKQFEVIHKYK